MFSDEDSRDWNYQKPRSTTSILKISKSILKLTKTVIEHRCFNISLTMSIFETDFEIKLRLITRKSEIVIATDKDQSTTISHQPGSTVSILSFIDRPTYLKSTKVAVARLRHRFQTASNVELLSNVSTSELVLNLSSSIFISISNSVEHLWFNL